MTTKNYAAQITVGGALSASFSTAVGGAKKELEALGRTVKNINAAQASLGKGKGIVDFDALKKARQSMRDAEAAAAKLNAELAKSKNPTREQAAALAKAQMEAAKARERYEALRRTQLETVRAVKAATGSYRVNADTVKKLGDAAQRAAARMAMLRAAGENVGKIGSAFRSAAAQARTFALVTAGAVTAVVGATAGLAKSFSDAGDSVAVTAQKIGITTDALQQFRYIGALSGVSAEDMDSALGKLSVRMAKAGIEGDAMAEDLRKLGLGLNLTALRAMGPEKAMLAIADAMERTNDPAKKLALTTIMFGDKAGPRMIGVLSQGRKGMREMAAEARKIGAVMDKEMIEKAQELDDAWDRAGAAFTGIKNIVGAELAPVVTGFLQDFVNWTMENRAEIGRLAREFGAWLRENGPAIKDAVVSIGSAIASIAGAINSVVQATVGWGGAIKILGALWVGKVLWSVASGVVWIGKLVGVMAQGASVAGYLGNALMWAGRSVAVVVGGVTALVAAIGAAVAAVGYLGYTIYKHWSAMPEIIDEAFVQIGNAISTAVDFYMDKFKALFDWVIGGFAKVGSFVKDTWNSVTGFLGFGDEEQPAAAVPGTGAKSMPRAAFAGVALAAGIASPGAALDAPTAAANIPAAATAAAVAPAPAGATTINVQGAPGQDPKAIAAEVKRVLDERERAQRRGGLND